MAPAEPKKEISRGIIAIYKAYLGRGPTTARTTINEGLVSTVCEGNLTKAEQSLIADGSADTVHDIRRTFQGAMREEIIALVERVLDRKAKTLLSDHDVVNDVAVETVVLEG